MTTILDHFVRANYYEIYFKDQTRRNILVFGEQHERDFKKNNLLRLRKIKSDSIFQKITKGIKKLNYYGDNDISVPEYYYLLANNGYECVDLFVEAPRHSGKIINSRQNQLDFITKIFGGRLKYDFLRYHEVEMMMKEEERDPKLFLDWLFNPNIDLEKLKTEDYENTQIKLLILKQYSKYLFYDEDLQILKDAILFGYKTVEKQKYYMGDQLLEVKFGPDRFINDIYFILRMTVKNKFWEKNNNSKCNGYPKNIIYHCGDAHRFFVHQVIGFISQNSSIIRGEFEYINDEKIKNENLPFSNLISDI